MEQFNVRPEERMHIICLIKSKEVVWEVEVRKRVMGDEIRKVASRIVPLGPTSDPYTAVLAISTMNRGTYVARRTLWR